MALDLKRLDPRFPVEAMGVVGDDDLGRFLYGSATATASSAARFWRCRAAPR
jgi:sugar/nucleoside kinase (ribokinase family)